MTLFKAFRIVGFLEGLSYLLLLLVAVPIKYGLGRPEGVKALGMPHGILFMAYVILAVNLGSEEAWSRKKIFGAFLASVLPFGTFVFDRKYLGAPRTTPTP